MAIGLALAMPYPRRTRRGPVEALWTVSGFTGQNPYPRRTRRGPVEASSIFAPTRLWPRYPRRTRRGPVEALPRRGQVIAPRPIRDVRVAAPLKQLLDNLNG